MKCILKASDNIEVGDHGNSTQTNGYVRFQCEKLDCLWSSYYDLVKFVFYFFSDICLRSFGGAVNCSLVCTGLETK